MRYQNLGGWGASGNHNVPKLFQKFLSLLWLLNLYQKAKSPASCWLTLSIFFPKPVNEPVLWIPWLQIVIKCDDELISTWYTLKSFSRAPQGASRAGLKWRAPTPHVWRLITQLWALWEHIFIVKEFNVSWLGTLRVYPRLSLYL